VKSFYDALDFMYDVATTVGKSQGRLWLKP